MKELLTKMLWLALAAFLAASCRSQRPGTETEKGRSFPVVETTIAQIHKAMQEGRLTCVELAAASLRRIEAYDQATGLNAIVAVNPRAIETAEELDEEFRRTGRLRPLHGIPVIVKDNYDTKDLPTTAGSLALKGSIPPDDAFQVRKLREAGAVILAKSNMAEWAFSPYVTESSLAGVTRNPYDLDRVPAGSSGGTAAAVAASFGAVGLGTDTGNSIRGPSSHCCLVGIRSTMGLTSRDGIVPLYLRNDIGGPMARTVEDAVRVLEVIAGYDPADPITEACHGRVPERYTSFLDKSGLKGARIGVFRTFIDLPETDPQIKALIEKAITDMKAQGAEIVDPFLIPDFEALTADLWCDMFKHDVEQYLASRGPVVPFKTLADIYKSGLYAPYIKERLEEALAVDGKQVCLDLYHEPRDINFREAVLKAMEESRLDAFIYPTWSNPPRKVGDMESPAGDNSQIIPPHTGLPGFNLPMGFTHGNLPAGLQIVGKLFGEPELIRIAYAYEQATRHRRPPENFPELE
jgi:amidase